eukprot:scaffold743_cov177-Ochromonas_danica.AAC.19
MVKFFLPAPQFAGRKDGYIYKNGDFGLGYYKDVNTLLVNRTTSEHENENSLGKRRREEEDGRQGNSNANTRHAAKVSGNGSSSSSSSSSQAQRIMEKEVTRDNHEDDDDDDENDDDNDDGDGDEDDGNDAGTTPLDSITLKQLLLTFEKKITQNQKLRIKFGDEPEKFMESEFDLHQSLQALHLVAAYPHLFPTLLQSGSLTSLLGMVAHENTDISLAAVSLFQEMIDEDNAREAPEETTQLLEAFLKAQGLELISQNLLRLDETSSDEDAQGVYNTFNLLEIIMERGEDYPLAILTRTQILSFLIQRVQSKVYDANKLYASELLSSLTLSLPEEVAKRVVQEEVLFEGLLQAIAHYRKREVKLAEEVECLENLFLTLSTLLLQRGCQEVFVRLEGLELLVRCLQGQQAAAFCSLSTLSSALLHSPQACARFVEVGGLKCIFAYLFLVTDKTGGGSKHRLVAQKQRSLEESLVTSLAQLALHLGGDVTSDAAKRLASKGLENDGEKVRLLCDLFVKHKATLVKAEEDIERIRERLEQEQDEEEIEALQELLDPENVYEERLRRGLFVLQQVAVMLAFLVRMHPAIWNTFEKAMKERKSSAEEVLDVLRELAFNLHEEEEKQKKEEESEEQELPAKRQERELCTQWTAIWGCGCWGAVGPLIEIDKFDLKHSRTMRKSAIIVDLSRRAMKHKFISTCRQWVVGSFIVAVAVTFVPAGTVNYVTQLTTHQHIFYIH